MPFTHGTKRSIAKRTLLLLAVCIAANSLAACSGNHSSDAPTTPPAQSGAASATGTPSGAARRVADQAKQDTTP